MHLAVEHLHFQEYHNQNATVAQVGEDINIRFQYADLPQDAQTTILLAT